MTSSMISVSQSVSAVSSSDILSLDIDCLEELFEWLSLRDLQALRATCKRMKQAVNYHIHTTYPNGFGKLEISTNNLVDLFEFDSSFCSVYKHITFSYCPLTNGIINDIGHILNKIETIQITTVHMNGGFHEDFLRFCQNLKHLYIGNFGKFSSSIGNEWLLHSCNSLERLTLIDQYFDNKIAVKVPQLQIFFENNLHLKRFATEGRFLQENQHWMLGSPVELNQLDIVLNSTLKKEVASICDILKALHERGFYKRLHLYLYFELEQDNLNRIARLNGLERMHLNFKSIDIVWPPMPQLKSFCKESDCYFDMNVLTDSFLNIEQIYLEYANFDKILPFIQRSPKLKVIKIDYPRNGIYCHDGIVELSALNKARLKCTNASKVTIFVGEEEYLQTKRTIMKTNFRLIELKRAETHGFECII